MISPIAEQIRPAIAIPLPGLCFTRTIIENASPSTANIPETYQKQQHTSDKIPSTRDAIANPDGLNVLWLAPCPFTSWYPALFHELSVLPYGFVFPTFCCSCCP